MAPFPEQEPYLGSASEERLARPSTLLLVSVSPEETNLHLFFQCQASQQIWYELSLSLDFPYQGFSAVQDGFFWWCTHSDARLTMFLLVCWTIWKWRNDSIFNSSRRPISSIVLSIKAFLDYLGK